MPGGLMVRDPLMRLFKWPHGIRSFLDEMELPVLDLEEELLLVDILEEEGQVVVRASLPGFRKEEIEAEIQNGVLSIRAERSEEREEKGRRYYRRERRMGVVSRRVLLPGVAAGGEVRAELKDGVLTLRIPVGEGAKPKQIPIETG